MHRIIIIALAALLPLVVNAAELTVKDGWARASIPGAANGAAYVSMANETQTAVTIVNWNSTASEKTELHTHRQEQGMMKMVHIPQLTLAPGESIAMQPGGYHIMLLDLQQPLRPNTKLQLMLSFADGTTQTFELDVRKP